MVKPTERRVGYGVALGYGITDLFGGGAFAIIGTWLLFFYTTYCGLSVIEAGSIFAIARVIDALLSPIMGYITDNFAGTWLGRKFGRRRFFLIAGPLIVVLGSALLYVLTSVPGLSLGSIMLLVAVLAVLVTSPWGVIITYINERFVTDVRATGFGMGFSLSVIIPSFYAFYMDWLSALMPLALTSVVLLALGGIIGTVGAYMGPETKDVDF